MPRAHGHWLVKSEPAAYGWSDLVADGRTIWDGVRNPQARNHLAAMREGDLVLYYHSGEGKEVVGVARVAKEASPDPTSSDPRWLVVELAPVAPLARPVALAEIKADPELRGMPLVRQSRLSVMPIERAAFEHLLRVSGTRLARR
jgi:predicted RNA-binding protein with PUA-like domain